MFTLLHDGSKDEAYFLFHGTGGNDFQLLRVMEELNPNATIIGVKATEGVGSNRRYFSPLINGQLDRKDFESNINGFMEEWKKRGFAFKKKVFLGYSNGANFIIGIIEKYPHIMSEAILLHPSNLNYHFEVESGMKVIMTSGATDNLALPGDVLKLKETMNNYYKNLTYFLFDGGHELTEVEIKAIKDSL